MTQHDSPKVGANITLLAKNNGRIQAQFHSVLGEDWTIAFKAEDLDWLYSVESVELNFIMNNQVCIAQAGLGGLDTRLGRCVLVNIHSLKSRPLRGQERVGADLSCAIILREKSGASSDYISSRQNSVSDISRSGAMLSTSRELDASRGILLLFALEGHPDLEPPNDRLFVAGRIVRNVSSNQSMYQYHYGIQFLDIPPGFFEMLSSYVEYLKSKEKNSARV